MDDGEKTSSKATPEMTLTKMKDILDVEDYLPVSTIKSYFSRRAKKLRTGKITVEGSDGEDSDSDDDYVNERLAMAAFIYKLKNYCFGEMPFGKDLLVAFND